MTPLARIHRTLNFLYGDSCSPDLHQRVLGLLGRFPAGSASVHRDTAPAAISQRDALVITYADQVTREGESPLRTLAGFFARHFQGMVSGIHLLPFYPSSSDDGFSVKDYFAVDPALGTWEDVGRLRGGFDLMFDAVFNHVSARSAWFQRFLADDPGYRDFFIPVEGQPDLSQVVRPRALPLLTRFDSAAGPKHLWTTFGPDQVDLNFANPEVLLRAVEALLYYVTHGARFIRLDAIAFLWKQIGTPCLHLPQTHAVVQLLRAVLDERAPHVQLLTETNVPHQDNVSYFGDGTNEAHLVYNFALPPLVLHSFAASSAIKLTRWAQSLALPTDGVTFFNFLASHDGIGLNPARGILSEEEIEILVSRAVEHGGLVSYKALPGGTRQPYELNLNFLDALSNPAANEPPELGARRFLTAQAILLCLKGVPGLYFHSLVGSRGDRLGAEVSGMPRRINRQKFEWFRLEAELQQGGSLRARVLAGHRELLRLRREHPAFAPAARQCVLECDARLFAVMRQSMDAADEVVCLQNVSPDCVTVCLREYLRRQHDCRVIWGHDQCAASGERLVMMPFGSAWLGAGVAECGRVSLRP